MTKQPTTPSAVLAAFDAMFGTEYPKRRKTPFCEWCGEDAYAGEKLRQYDPGGGAELVTLCPTHAQELEQYHATTLHRTGRFQEYAWVCSCGSHGTYDARTARESRKGAAQAARAHGKSAARALPD